MRTILLSLLAAGAIVGASALGMRPGAAQYAAQLYPYCSLSPSSGATNCYVASRQQCGSSCISNPWSIGARRAAPYLDGRRALVPRYVRP